MSFNNYSLHIRLDTATIDALDVMRKAGGYRTRCETARTILRAAAFARIEAPDGSPEEEEIAAVFARLGDSQRQPDGNAPKKTRTANNTNR